MSRVAKSKPDGSAARPSFRPYGAPRQIDAEAGPHLAWAPWRPVAMSAYWSLDGLRRFLTRRALRHFLLFVFVGLVLLWGLRGFHDRADCPGQGTSIIDRRECQERWLEATQVVGAALFLLAVGFVAILLGHWTTDQRLPEPGTGSMGPLHVPLWNDLNENAAILRIFGRTAIPLAACAALVALVLGFFFHVPEKNMTVFIPGVLFAMGAALGLTGWISLRASRGIAIELSRMFDAERPTNPKRRLSH